eukprot:8096453-Pyramimonas_sp.AAC.1
MRAQMYTHTTSAPAPILVSECAREFSTLQASDAVGRPETPPKPPQHGPPKWPKTAHIGPR